MQRLIVAQINQTNNVTSSDPYSGLVDYNNTPWFDWGPYLWASAQNFSSAGVNWCNGQNSSRCPGNISDFRSGNSMDSMQWGDFTHPGAPGEKKVATQIMNFLVGSTGSPFVQHWITF
ncbi:MAG TPA: hypothetical protein VFA68_01015 [Terriglobales bacterium]|nr:hypothetical protein [Terriglobales bacterium]